MELTYRHLPHHLKPCLLYFGAFTEDQEVSVRRLVQLWKAEGFIQISGQKRITDVSGEYVKELIERSLVMIAKKGSAGGARSCRIHDLVREFCLRKAEKESFFHLLNRGHDQLSDFNEPRHLRRLCIYYDGKGFKDSKLFCPRARSLMLFSSQKKPGYEQYWLATSFIIPIFKLLKVLDLEQIHLGDEFPSEIEILLQLRYLSIRGGMEAIPASIGKLSNLETLIVYLERVHLNVSFPRTLWNLKKLKWLFINSGGGILPVENLEDSPILQELESLSCAVMYSHAIMEKHLRKFPNIRRLKCDLSRLFAQNQNLNEIVVPGFLEKLESLHLLLSDLTLMKQKRHATFDFSLPASLKKLTLSRFGLPWEKISAIGKELNQLEVLKLLDSCFVGDTWEMQYDEFPNLRYLKLSRLDHVNWTADASFECLEKLVLESCSNLVDIPGCLGSVTKLKTIDVISCSDGLESVVQEIERQQKEDWGNKSFKVRSC